MRESTVQILHYRGVHSRPAHEIVKCAAKFTSEIWLEKDGDIVNAKSIMGIRMLDIRVGEYVRVQVEGPDEEQAINAMLCLLISDFGDAY